MAIKLNKLEQLGLFKKILDDYNPSPSSLEILRQSFLVLLVAPTAAGRNTLISQLVKSGNYHYLVSDTTRQPRINNNLKEKNGQEYWFKTEKQFLVGLSLGEYLEAAIIHQQQVSGINISELQTSSKESKIAITDIDIQGCEKLLSYSQNILPIFILPPTFEEWIKRLDLRGKMLVSEKNRRLTSAKYEIEKALTKNYFSFITNNDLLPATEELNRLIITKNIDPKDQERHKRHAQKLVTNIRQYLLN